jgi:hypothetical protein
MGSLLDACIAIASYTNQQVDSHIIGRNRMNHMGAALENYVKDAFANCLHVIDEKEKLAAYEHTYAYLGNQNNIFNFT